MSQANDSAAIARGLSEDEIAFLENRKYATQNMLNRKLVRVINGMYVITPLGVVVREFLQKGGTP
jgi:hypothetical protein